MHQASNCMQSAKRSRVEGRSLLVTGSQKTEPHGNCFILHMHIDIAYLKRSLTVFPTAGLRDMRVACT